LAVSPLLVTGFLEAYALCAEAKELLARNVETLRAGTPKSELEQYLWDWAIVLGVLARDVLGSTVLLLNADQRRVANMLGRALADYDIRLRYYVVQYLKLQQKYRKRQHVPLPL